MTEQSTRHRDRQALGREPEHHPGEELLLDYAAGGLPEAAALAVACHASLCPQCRRDIARLEAVGGSAVTAIPPVPVGDHVLDAVMAQLDRPAPGPDAAEETGAEDPRVPYPLRAYLPGGLDGLRWRARGRAVAAATIDAGEHGRTSLLRIQPGAAVPRHTHRGRELTVVLDGGYRDGEARFLPGDCQVADGSVEHRPVADPDGICLCLVVQDAPLRLTGRIGRLIDPFVRL